MSEKIYKLEAENHELHKIREENEKTIERLNGIVDDVLKSMGKLYTIIKKYKEFNK